MGNKDIAESIDEREGSRSSQSPRPHPRKLRIPCSSGAPDAPSACPELRRASGHLFTLLALSFEGRLFGPSFDPVSALFLTAIPSQKPQSRIATHAFLIDSPLQLKFAATGTKQRANHVSNR
jgi:hypothetical protein